MEGLEGIVEDTKDIIEVATKYYKNMFKFEARPEIHIAQDVFLVMMRKFLVRRMRC
jgi:hypothetical protein